MSTVGSTLWGMAPVVAVVLGIVLDSISPNQRYRTRFPLGDGSGVTTCPRGGKCSASVAADPDPREWVRDLHVPSGLPRMGPGTPRAIRTPANGSGTSTCHPDSRELSAQLAAREGSGAATCHADAGVGRDRTGVLAPAGGMVVAVGGTILQAWRGGVPRVLQARVLSRSRPEPLPRVVPMPFEGSAEGKVRRRYGELAV